MEIKEGMYVRTTKGIGKIEKIIERDGDNRFGFYTDKGMMDLFRIQGDEEILGEPSFNILDLVQEGDLMELTSKYCKDEIYRVVDAVDGLICLDCFGDGYMTISVIKDIKRILTKEQFAAMAYEVK